MIGVTSIIIGRPSVEGHRSEVLYAVDCLLGHHTLGFLFAAGLLEQSGHIS